MYTAHVVLVYSSSCTYVNNRVTGADGHAILGQGLGSGHHARTTGRVVWSPASGT